MNISKAKLITACLVALVLVGCATPGSVSRKMVANKETGAVYGTSSVVMLNNFTEDLCKEINYQDPRCADASQYFVVPVWSKFGFADGNMGINALIKKDHPEIEKLKAVKMLTGGDKNNKVFVKAAVIPGQLGEILEVVSVDGDGKCYWSGLPRAGGTVCPGLYDYRTDYLGIRYN